MGKRGIGVLAASLLFVGAGVAPAGEDPPVSMNPNPVRQNKTVTVVAGDCVSGDGWTAHVAVTIEDSEGNVKHDSYQPASESGTTTVPIKIGKKKYKKGMYLVFIECIHEFDEGGTGVWYSTSKDLKVKRAKRPSES